MQHSYFAARDRGRQRSTNQDHAVAAEIAPGCVLLAVADGVGGARGGEVASAETLRVVRRELEQGEGSERGARLRAAARAANREVRKLAAGDGDLAGMASTLVAALVQGSQVTVLNAGDSRAYHCRQAGISALTEDDSWVAEQVRAGLLTPEEAERSPYRNAITRGIGVLDELDDGPLIELSLAPGEVLLLCSDGLYRAVEPATIAKVLRGATPERAATRLIDLANEAGGPDNIAVAVYRAG